MVELTMSNYKTILLKMCKLVDPTPPSSDVICVNLCEGEQAVPERHHPAPDRDGAGDVRALLGRGGVREPGRRPRPPARRHPGRRTHRQKVRVITYYTINRL